MTQRLDNCRKNISSWKRTHQTNAQEQIRLLQYQLDIACSRGEPSSTQQRLRDQLNQAYQDEENYLKKKSRNPWLSEGDRNTKYYHSITSTRRTRINTALLDDARDIQREDELVTKVAEKYFTDQLTKQEIKYTELYEVLGDF